MCGEGFGASPSSTSSVLSAYASFSTVTSTTDDTLNYQRDYQFNPSNNKYCGGIYSNGEHMYVLIMSDKDALGHFKMYLYLKDIIMFTDDHMKSIDLSPMASALHPHVYNFIVKQENGAKTMFFSGSSDNLGQATHRTNFIMKFSV